MKYVHSSIVLSLIIRRWKKKILEIIFDKYNIIVVRSLLLFVYSFIVCLGNEKGIAVVRKRGRIVAFHYDELTVLSVIQTGNVILFPAGSPSAPHLHTEGSHWIRNRSFRNYSIDSSNSRVNPLVRRLNRPFNLLVIFSSSGMQVGTWPFKITEFTRRSVRSFDNYSSASDWIRKKFKNQIESLRYLNFFFIFFFRKSSSSLDFAN